jgi:hypothetical protein
MEIYETNMSCGVVQIDGLLSNPKDNLIKMSNYFYQDNYYRFAYIQWSDVWGRNKSGNKLYHYINKLFPGTVTRTKPVRNPNSSNTICIYTFRIPERKLKSWWKENCPNSYEKYWL